MYCKVKNHWIKHGDFMFLDWVTIQLSFALAYLIRSGFANPYEDSLYRNTAIFIGLVTFCSFFFTENHRGIMRRNGKDEFRAVLQQIIIIVCTILICLFAVQNSSEFSRIILFTFAVIAVIAVWAERELWKEFLKKYHKKINHQRAMLVIGNRAEIPDMIETLQKNLAYEIKISGIIYLDGEGEGVSVHGVPVVASSTNMVEYIMRNWVDEIFCNGDDLESEYHSLFEQLTSMGITVHRSIVKSRQKSKNQYLESIGGYMVLTNSMANATVFQLAAKRAIDIVGSLVGLAFTAVLTVVLAPMIYIQSPGPIFFSQTRIGRNGKPFRIYKFRSMYMDAEKRKEELMKKNKMQGLMFKADNDPRIIGSGEDGKKHGIGWFIRKTSLDEFPQFWNVLKGDMSLVGTRPPTLDEWNRYSLHHRARMAIRPGITGMWQVNGRSDITDFEDVVSLDTAYICNWSIWLDIKILIRTVFCVIAGKGAE